jgi:hypothetical protein
VNQRNVTFRLLTICGAACLLSACATNSQIGSLPDGAVSPPQSKAPLMQSDTYYGCPEFTDGTYTGDITNAPVDPNSKSTSTRSSKPATPHSTTLPPLHVRKKPYAVSAF